MMIKKSHRVAIYTRVSTDGQTCPNQERELRAVAKLKDCEIVQVYTDHGISGAKGRDQRPAFDALCKDAVRREFDVVMAWSVDRLGRSLQDLIAFLNEIHAVGVDLYLHQQGLDTSTPAGKAMFGMLGAFAEFERELIRERVMAGLERAKAQGKQLGRPTVGRSYRSDDSAPAAQGHWDEADCGHGRRRGRDDYQDQARNGPRCAAAAQQGGARRGLADRHHLDGERVLQRKIDRRHLPSSPPRLYHGSGPRHKIFHNNRLPKSWQKNADSRQAE